MWIGWAYFWARHRETSLRNTSPTTIPRTLPLGLVRATIRPRPMARAISAGILAWAKCRATRMRLVVAVSSSSRMRRVSVVRPDGPGAAPLRANFAAKILRLYKNLFSSGHILSSWRRTSFMMLAKHRKAALVTDFRPIASVRLFYKIFAYVILHRIEPCLDSNQPEKTKWFPCWTTLGRTFAHRKFLPRQDLGGKHSGVDIELGLVKSF